MSRIAAVAPALPAHVHRQEDITAALAELIGADSAIRARMDRLHRGSGIATRHTVLPLSDYRQPVSFGRSNDLWIEHGLILAERACRQALAVAAVAPDEVDFILFTSVTGLAAPSLDARLMPRLGMRPDVKRMPSFGLGCVAGAAGLARVHDYLEGDPAGVALLVSVELCSLTVQAGDRSTANLVASGLFGDGAAAVVMVGEQRMTPGGRADNRRPSPSPRIVATRSALYDGTEDVIGWDVGAEGFRIRLTAGVADAIDANFGRDVESFLAGQGLAIGDVGCWIAHPGGPRVLEAFERALKLTRADTASSWRSLAAVGNLSSSSVLHILDDQFAQPAGTIGLLFALGPGVSAELVLLEWS